MDGQHRRINDRAVHAGQVVGRSFRAMPRPGILGCPCFILRPLRGVNNAYLYQYVAMFEWSYDIKRVTAAFLWALLGLKSSTI